ncbi:MAG: TIM barrel protein [Acidobacteria bacterium]|nr:TIM barrel protein [Acidobacteriota bacterium]
MFRMENLVAWCIVPFDARQRGPEARAAMLARLGFKKFVYDWRDKDIPFFDAEIDALQKHGIHLQGFWTPFPASAGRPGQLPKIFDLLKRRRLKTELWLSPGFAKGFELEPEAEKIRTAADAVLRVARQAAELDCNVGLYNHGGWFGEPENQLEVLEQIRMKNAGIVYNFHHGHDHVPRFPSMFERMKSRLLAVNLNGMRQGTKILPLGEGNLELEMLRTLIKSGYKGPIGILGHRNEIDAEEALRLNLEGLRTLSARLG